METVIHVTGAGVVSAVGCGQGETLDALRRGRSGIAPVRYLRTEEKAFPVGEVKLSDAEMAARCGARQGLSRTSLMGILALEEALAQAGLEDLTGVPLIGGTTVGGMDLTERIFPAYSPVHDCGASTDAIAAHFGGAPWATTLSTACSSAANAVIFGANLIRSGQAEIVAVGGSESLSDFHLHGFGSLMILDTAPCRPFDATRAGLNLGEGAAFLILESEASRKRRGAASLAVLSGFGNACDAFHQTASSENGEGAFLAMQKALKMAGLRPEDIDYVNAHGTGTPNNDASKRCPSAGVRGEDASGVVHQGLHGPYDERLRQHRGGLLPPGPAGRLHPGQLELDHARSGLHHARHRRACTPEAHPLQRLRFRRQRFIPLILPMMRKVYVHARCELKPGDPEPDYRSLFSVMEARRMGRLLKRAVWTSAEALKEAGIAVPDAVVIGTDFGCIENSESFLKALKGLEDAPLRPTHFMQSTHNTIASLIAIRLGCHGYNATYSHRGRSFESALQDAATQIALGDIDNALVGWFDEMTPNLSASLVSQGIEPKEHALAVVLSANPEGALDELSF